MSQEVRLTIDGREVVVPAGTLVIRAAERLGIYIPRFCDHPYLEPMGACRTCMVEIEGQRRPVTSCTTPVAEGMVVHTSSPMARAAQEAAIEFLLTNHPLDCPYCDRGGECPLQDQTLAYGPGGSRYAEPRRRFLPKPLRISPLILLDRERCVQCARCVRFTAEVAGEPDLVFTERGARQQVSIAPGVEIGPPFSGNVVQICPVGALTSTTYRFRARPFDLSSATGVCPLCASGCRVRVDARAGRIVRHLAEEDPSTNLAWICDRGRYAHFFLDHPSRVVEPMVRKEGELVAVGWEEALEAVAERALEVKGGKYPVPAAALGGAHLADQDALALSRVFRELVGVGNLDAGVGMSDPSCLLPLYFGEVGYADLDGAERVLLVGLDPREELPILFLRLRQAWRKRGLVVMAVGPRFTSGAYLPSRFLGAPPSGVGEELGRLRGELGPGDVVLVGEEALSWRGAAEAALELAGGVGAKIALAPRRGNLRGAIRAGLHPGLLPGPRGSGEVGLARREVLDAASRGDLGLLWIVGEDPRRWPGWREALEGAGFVVVQDILVPPEVLSLADVVLPAAGYAERKGTITGWDGVRRPLPALREPPGLCLPDYEILSYLAELAGMSLPTGLEAWEEELQGVSAQAPRVSLAGAGGAGGGRRGLEAFVARPLLAGRALTGSGPLEALAARAVVEVSPDTAAALGLEEGMPARVRTEAGEALLPWRASAAVAPGVIYLPAGVPGLPAVAESGWEVEVGRGEAGRA